MAWGPSVETGANVPSYSGGVAALLGDSYRVFEGCGLSAKCENRGQRPQLQWRRRRLIWVLVWVFSLAPALAQSHGFDIIHPTPDPEYTPLRNIFGFCAYSLITSDVCITYVV